MVEHRTPNPAVGGSSPSWPEVDVRCEGWRMEDNRKYITLIIMGLAAISAEVLFQMLTAGVTYFRLSTSHFVGGVSWDIVGRAISYGVLVVAAIVAYRKLIVYEFLNDVCNELRKVTWPQGKETAASTVIVVIMVVISALILFAFDWLWGTIVRGFL